MLPHSASASNKINEITGSILDASFRIHSRVGPGMLEGVYEKILEYELKQAGLKVLRQWPIPLVYDDIKLQDGFRADLIVENCIVVEIKSVEQLAPVHFKQVTSYLRCSGHQIGLLINFNVAHLKEGIHRIVNRFEG